MPQHEARANSSQHAHNGADYLAAIFEIGEEGAEPNQAQIARRLGVSRATVSEQVGRLTKQGLVRSKGRVLSLTGEGRSQAETTVRRHRMAERFLTDVLGLPWHLAHQEGESFQDGITDEVEQRIMAMLSGPRTCPHGNPIPGSGATMPTDLRPLHEIEPPATVTLVRLTEDIEIDTAILKHFEDHGIMPGAEIEVTGRAPDGTFSLRVGRKRSSLGPQLADNLWVRATKPRPNRNS